MTGSLNQFVLIKARTSRGVDHWSLDDYDVRDSHGKVVLIGYLLNRGIYVGSITMLDTASGLLVYEKQCHYLHLDGVRDVRVNADLDEEDARHILCPLLSK